MKKESPDQLVMFADLVPLGGGRFNVVYSKPLLDDLTPRQAARFLGLSRPSVYRLIEMGCFECKRPSPGKILITLASLKAHKEKSGDPEFWLNFKNPSQDSQSSQAS